MDERPPQGEPEPTQDDPKPQVEERTALATAVADEKPETPTEKPPEGKAEETPDEQRLPEGWRDTTEGKGLRAEGYAEAQSQLEKSHQRSLKQLKADQAEQTQQTIRDTRAEQNVTNTLRAVEGFMSKLNEMDEGQAQQRLGQLLQENREWASIFSKQWVDSVRKEGTGAGFQDGLTSVSRMLFKGLVKDSSEALTEFVDDLNLEVRAGDLDRGDALGKIIAKRDELIRSEESAKLLKLREEREGQEAHAAKRDGQEPPVKVAGKSGGGMSEDEELMDLETPITRLKEIMARRKA